MQRISRDDLRARLDAGLPFEGDRIAPAVTR